VKASLDNTPNTAATSEMTSTLTRQCGFCVRRNS
jgi:hypothetical protein